MLNRARSNYALECKKNQPILIHTKLFNDNLLPPISINLYSTHYYSIIPKKEYINNIHIKIEELKREIRSPKFISNGKIKRHKNKSICDIISQV